MSTNRTATELMTPKFLSLSGTDEQNLALLEKELCQPNCTIETLFIQNSALLNFTAVKKIAAILKNNYSVTKLEFDHEDHDGLMYHALIFIALAANGASIDHLRHLLAKCKTTSNDPTILIAEVRAYLDQGKLNHTIQTFAATPKAAKHSRSIASPLATLHRLLGENTHDLNTQILACIEYLTIFISIYRIQEMCIAINPQRPTEIVPALVLPRDVRSKLGTTETEIYRSLAANLFDIYNCLSTLPLRSENTLVEHILIATLTCMGISLINVNPDDKEQTSVGVSFMLAAAAKIAALSEAEKSERVKFNWTRSYFVALKILEVTCKNVVAMKEKAPDEAIITKILSDALFYTERLETILTECSPKTVEFSTAELSDILANIAEFCRVIRHNEEYEKWVIRCYQLKSRLKSIIPLYNYMLSLAVAFQLHCPKAYEKLLDQTIVHCLESDDDNKYDSIAKMAPLIGAYGGIHYGLSLLIQTFIMNNAPNQQLLANEDKLANEYSLLTILLKGNIVNPHDIKATKTLYLIMMKVIRDYNKPTFPNSSLRRYLNSHPEKVEEIHDGLNTLYQCRLSLIEHVESDIPIAANPAVLNAASAARERLVKNKLVLTNLEKQLNDVNARNQQLAQQLRTNDQTRSKRKNDVMEQKIPTDTDTTNPHTKRRKRGS